MDEAGRLSCGEIAVSSDSSTATWNCCAWDCNNGNIITTYKLETSSPRSLSLIDRDYFVSAVKNKPIINVWPCCKPKTTEQRFVVPGVVSALSISPRNSHCVAAIDKTLYVWEIPSGEMVSIVQYHQQEVKCIKFTSDGFHFISGGRDSLVLVWQLGRVLKRCREKKVAKPMYVWDDHRSAITDIYVGKAALKARVATTSYDQSCIVYSLWNGKKLISVFTDTPLLSTVMDLADYYFYMGTGNGDILQVTWHACGEKDSLNIVEKETEDIFKGHRGPVTCLACSTDGTLLLSGSDDGTSKVWDVQSKASIVLFKHNGPVTNVLFMMAPSCFFGGECIPPQFEKVNPFSRSMTKDTVDRVVEVKLKSLQPGDTYFESIHDMLNKAVASRLATSGAQSKAELQKGFVEMKTVNRQLFSFSTNSFMHNIKDFKVFEH